MTHVLLRVRPYPTDTSDGKPPVFDSALKMETVLASTHNGHESFALAMAHRNNQVALLIHAPKHAALALQEQLYAHFPHCLIENEPTIISCGECTNLTLQHSELFPIRRHPQFTDINRRTVDPIAGMVSALSRGGMIVIHLTPAHHVQMRALRFLTLLEHGLPHKFHGYATFLTDLHFSRGWWSS